MNKTCNVKDAFCTYKFASGCYQDCKYEGYCDYQLPRDSRLLPLAPEKPKEIVLPEKIKNPYYDWDKQFNQIMQIVEERK